MTKKGSKRGITAGAALGSAIPLGGIAYIYFSQFDNALIDVVGTLSVALTGGFLGYIAGLIIFTVGRTLHPDKWET